MADTDIFERNRAQIVREQAMALRLPSRVRGPRVSDRWVTALLLLALCASGAATGGLVGWLVGRWA